jgi:hypothetical protein
MDAAGAPRDPVEVALAVDSAESLSAFLLDLAERARNGSSPVENETSLRMIEASAYWVEGMEEFLLARGRALSGISPWAMIAMIYSAGLIYE